MSALRDALLLTAWMATIVTISAALVALGTRPLIGWLRRRQFGKVIREDVPMHSGKAGTPTMGGLVLVAVLFMAGVVALWITHLLERKLVPVVSSAGPPALWSALGPNTIAIALVLLAMLGFGLLGVVDDWQGLARKGRARVLGVGLTARNMFALQAIVGLALALGLSRIGSLQCMGGPHEQGPTGPAWTVMSVFLHAPSQIVQQVGIVPWLTFATVAIVATVNGVNLSDGLDGLGAGLAALAFGGLAIVQARLMATGLSPTACIGNLVAPLELVAAGACLGFLVHNRYPARVFMGNVTSMALGGALATIALATGTWLLLPIIGIVYVAEVLSDIIQVGYFKWTGGKRFFRMAPIHHHFELLGMHETAVTRRFWLAGAAGAALAVGLVYWATWGVS